MRRINYDDLLTVTGTTRNTFRTHRSRDQIALAFGRSNAYNSMSFVEIDAVAMVLCGTLAKSYSRPVSAQLVRLDCDRWCEAIAMAEADADRAANYCIVDFQDADGVLSHLTCATNSSDLDWISHTVALSPKAFRATAQRITAVNMHPLIRKIQTTAADRGIELASPWLPPLGSDDFRDLFAAYAVARNGSVEIARVRSAYRAGELARTMLEGRLQ